MPPQKCLLRARPAPFRYFAASRSRSPTQPKGSKADKGRRRSPVVEAKVERDTAPRPRVGFLSIVSVLRQARGCQLEKAGSMRLAKLRKGGACL